MFKKKWVVVAYYPGGGMAVVADHRTKLLARVDAFFLNLTVEDARVQVPMYRAQPRMLCGGPPGCTLTHADHVARSSSPDE